MKLGMLWLDDDKAMSLEAKIRRAAEYYQDKYGKVPDLCLVNKKMLTEDKQIDAIEVRPVKHVLPDHFWLGVSTN